MTRLMKQLEEDRGRTLLHSGILEQQIVTALEELGKAQALPDNTPQLRSLKKSEIGRWMTHFRQMSYHKIESLRTLFDSTEAITKFLTLFSGGKGKGFEGEGLKNLLSYREEPEKLENQPVDYQTVIKILEDKDGGVLPSQNIKLNNGPRNPSEGFEELINPEEEN